MIGDHELDTVPKSLMTSDGALHPGHNNKHQLVDKLTDTYTRHTVVDEIVASYKTIVIDAMAVVQRIANNKNNQKKIKTCVEFSEKFIATVKGLVNGYEEVRIVFDNYHEVSLKNHTRDGRGKASHSRQFVIEDRTIIGMGLKEFLSDIQTKHDITIYLSNKFHTHFANLEVFYLVSVNSTTSGNIDAPLNDNHEEADTYNLALHTRY